MAKEILTKQFTEPLNEAQTAKINIHAGDGNLLIDGLTEGESLLASGLLEYYENQGLPTRDLVSSNEQVSLSLKGSRAGKPWFHLPWATCNGATEWQIHINPTVSSDITAHSDGGNIKLDLTDMIVTRLKADTGGGNLDVFLPNKVANLKVDVRTGAGNVVVNIPAGIPARIQATSGLGKTIVDTRFNQTGKNLYQSSDYEENHDNVEITAHSGAGNVSVTCR